MERRTKAPVLQPKPDDNTGLLVANPAYDELHQLTFTKLANNGLHHDDGTGTTNGSARGIVLRGLQVRDIGD